jgi:hypothetical protein
MFEKQTTLTCKDMNGNLFCQITGVAKPDRVRTASIDCKYCTNSGKSKPVVFCGFYVFGVLIVVVQAACGNA